MNNAGRGDWLPLSELDRQYFDGLVGLNLWAPLRLCQLAHPHLAASDDAAVVMIGSVDAVRPSAGGAVYGATKAGLAAVTVALAKEWRADGIRVTQGRSGHGGHADGRRRDPRADRGRRLRQHRGAGPDSPTRSPRWSTTWWPPAGRFATGTSFRLDGGAVALGPFDLLER